MTTVRLMTWNVRGSAGPDITALAEAITPYQPDVLAIQEIQRRQARRLARRLGFRWRWARKHFPYGPLLFWRAEGLATLSPHGVDARRPYLLSPGIPSWTYRRRIALRAKVRVPGITLRVFNVHLASHDATRDRIDQASILSGYIAEERQRAEQEGEPFRAVVLGDLNANDEAEVLAPLVAARFADAWTMAERRSDERGWTASSDEPAARIDYVLIGDADACIEAIVPTNDERKWHRLSDHLPVVAVVRLD